MMAKAPEPWAPIDGGWQRRLYGTELFIAASASLDVGPGQANLMTQATFTTGSATDKATFASLLRRAWLDVRFHYHPLVATICSAPGTDDPFDIVKYTITYPMVTVTTAGQWAQRTVVEHEPASMSDLVASLDPTTLTARGGSAELHWASSPFAKDTTFNVVFFAGHWLADARGAFILYDKILGALQRLSVDNAAEETYAWGEEVKRLSVPLPIATGKRVADSGDLVPLPREVLDSFLPALFDQLAQAEPALRLAPSTHRLPSTAPDANQDIIFSEEETSAVIQLCRSHGVTITALFNTLVIIAFAAEDQAALAASKTVQISAFSVNRADDYLEEFRDSLGLAISLPTFTLDSRLIEACHKSRRTKEAVWNAVKAARKWLLETKTDPYALVFDHEIYSTLLPIVFKNKGTDVFRETVPWVTSLVPITQLITNNMKADGPDSQWRITYVANGVTVKLNRPLCHFWEWQNQITIRIVSNGEYDQQHPIVRLKDDIVNLVKELST